MTLVFIKTDSFQSNYVSLDCERKVEHKPARYQGIDPELLLRDNSEEYVRRPADDLLGFRCYEDVKVSLGQKVKVAGGQNLTAPGTREPSRQVHRNNHSFIDFFPPLLSYVAEK